MTGVDETPQTPAPEQNQASETAVDVTEETAEDAVDTSLPATVYDCQDDRQRAAGLRHAQRALAVDECVVLPTDTVYGIGANAFSPAGVQRLLEIKGRNRTMPPPVLIAHAGVLDGLADEVSDCARALAEAFWPGGLTLICHAQPSLQWDLGETRGTVALRVPDDEVATALLAETGPLAVSSANRTGLPAATTAEQAREMLRDNVQVYLDAGHRGEALPTQHPVASTIVDCTAQTPVVVRNGAVSLERLREIVPSVIALGGKDEASGPEATTTEHSPGGEQDVTPGAHAVHEESLGGEAVHGESVHGESSQDQTVTAVVPGSAAEEATGGGSDSGPHTVVAQEGSAAEDPAVTASAPAAADHPDHGNDGQTPETVNAAPSVAPAASRSGSDAVSVRPGRSGTVVAQQAAAVVGAGGGSSAVGGAAPDQDRRRPRRAVSGEPHPLDRATAASIVARGAVDEQVGAEVADQVR